MTTQLKRQLLASQLTQKINENKEDTLRQAVSDFFRKQRNLVLAAFDEYYKEEMLLQGHIDLILAPIHELHQEYYELLLEHNLDMFHRGEDLAERLVERATNQQAMKAKRKKENIKITHDTINKYTEHFGTLQYSEDYLTNYTFTATEKTLSRVDAEVNKILTTGYKEGWGVRDVRNRILQRYDQFETWEANRIARTEMQTAHNMGMMNKYQEMGVEYKEWRSAHDKRVRGNRKSDRANHIIMDGEIAPLDQPFSNGLMYPGDKTGRIEEWINCRCSAVPYLMPPGTTAPLGRSTFTASDLVTVNEPNYGRLLQKETGGKLNWQQYKQILNGTPLEQVLSGAIAGATQTKQEEPIIDLTPKKLTPEELSKMSFGDLAKHHGVEYKGIKTYEYDGKNYHVFEEHFLEGNTFTLRFEEGAVKSYTKKGIATPNEIIHEVFKVPEVLRKETDEIWFKNTSQGIQHKYTKTGYDSFDATTGGYNSYLRMTSSTLNQYDSFHHRIVINPKYFKGGGKGKYAFLWEKSPNDAKGWKMTISHEFQHSGDKPRRKWKAQDNTPVCYDEEYSEIHKEEPYFTWYANTTRTESIAEHGGYISYMEANPNEQHKLLTIETIENGEFITKNIDYEDYKQMYPKHHNYFMKKFEEGF